MSKKKVIQWKQDYGFDELYDYERDIHESFDKRYNPDAAEPITDKHGVFAGIYRITIEYIEADKCNCRGNMNINNPEEPFCSSCGLLNPTYKDLKGKDGK